MPKRATLSRLHVVQRGELSTVRTWMLRLMAVLGALVTGGLFLLMLGFNPFLVYRTMPSVVRLRGIISLIVSFCMPGLPREPVSIVR